MKLTRQSTLTGKIHTKDIDVTQEQLDSYYIGGVLLQNAFPHLSPEDRDFIKLGATPQEWEDYIGSEKDDEDEDDNSYQPRDPEEKFWDDTATYNERFSGQDDDDGDD